MSHPLLEALHREHQQRDTDSQMILALTTQLNQARAQNRELTKTNTTLMRHGMSITAAYEAADDDRLYANIRRLKTTIRTNTKDNTNVH